MEEEYYFRAKDCKRLIIFFKEGYSKEYLERKGLLKLKFGEDAIKELEEAELHEGEDSLRLKIKGKGMISIEPWGRIKRCYGGERVTLYSDGNFEICQTIFSRMRRYLIKRGWIK